MSNKVQNTTAQSASINNTIVAGVSINGNVTTHSPLQIDGHLRGDVFSTSLVTVGKTALVDGQIIAKAIRVEGEIEGGITIASETHLAPSAVIEGVIHTNKLILAKGCQFRKVAFDGAKAYAKQQK